MKIYFATDHAGFKLKEILKEFVSLELSHEVKDFGATEFDEQDDYPDFVHRAAEAVNNSEGDDKAIVLGGSGQGEAMVANRHAGVRAIVYNMPNLEIIKLGREHNNANVLSLGARFLTVVQAKEAVKLWLKTDFSKESRHIRRIDKIDYE